MGATILFEGVIFLMTGARGAFLGILTGLGIIMFLQLIVANGWKRKLMFGSIIAIVVLIPVALFTFKDTQLIQGSSQISRLANTTLQSGQARFTIWKMAFEAFKEKPILGWGAGNFIVPFAKHYDPQMFTQEPWFDRTHNMFLEWLVAGGMLGFLAYLALFWSIVPALRQAVKQNIIENTAAFVFLGMIISYVIQLLFVFDTQATYLMLILILGFLYTVSSRSNEEWLQESAFSASPDSNARFWDLHIPEHLSRKRRRELKMKLDNVHENSPPLSRFKIGAITSIFASSCILITFVNIRPYMANLFLLDGLNLFNQHNFSESNTAFKRALQLSRGTIGTAEERENLTFNMYTLFQNTDYLKKPEGEALYHLAVDEMEKQVAQNSQKELNIKQNILLAQMYHQWALFSSNREALIKAFEQYGLAIQFAPNYVSIYPIVANLYAQSGNVSEAIRLIEKATELLTGAGKYDERTFYSKALFYTVANRYDDAYNALKEINEKYSSENGLDAEMMNNIVLATRSQGVGAIPFLERIYTIDEHVSAIALMLAQLHAAQGNKDKARFYANEVLKTDSSVKEKVQEFLNALDR